MLKVKEKGFWKQKGKQYLKSTKEPPYAYQWISQQNIRRESKAKVLRGKKWGREGTTILIQNNYLARLLS